MKNDDYTLNDNNIILVSDDKQNPQRRASVCSLDSGTSLSFLSSNGTRSSTAEHRTRRNQDYSDLAQNTRSTEV